MEHKYSASVRIYDSSGGDLVTVLDLDLVASSTRQAANMLREHLRVAVGHYDEDIAGIADCTEGCHL